MRDTKEYCCLRLRELTLVHRLAVFIGEFGSELHICGLGCGIFNWVPPGGKTIPAQFSSFTNPIKRFCAKSISRLDGSGVFCWKECSTYTAFSNLVLGYQTLGGFTTARRACNAFDGWFSFASA